MSSASISRRHLAILFVVALILTIGFLAVARDNPFVTGLTNDESFHVQEAESILHQGLVGQDAFYFAPLYPYLLAALFAAVGERITAVLAIQSVLGAVNVVLVLLLAWRVSKSQRVAWFAAGLTLLFGPYLMYQTLLLKTTLAVLLTSIALLLLFSALDHGTDWRWLACGLAFGLLCLVRGNVLIVLAFLFAGLLIEHRRGRATPRWIALWLTGIALGILPATAHNAVAALDFVPTTYQGGTNFYIGNRRGASGTYASLRPGRGHPIQERYDAVTLAEEATGHQLRPSQVSSYWLGRGLAEIREDPAGWARLLAKKAFLFHSDAEITDVIDYRVYRELSPALWAAPVSFGMLAALAIPGMFLFRRRPAAPMLALALVGSATSVILFFVFGRYRVPAVSLYILFAAVTLDWAIDVAARRSWRTLFTAAAIAAALYGILRIPVAETNPAMAYNTLAGMYARRGDLTAAQHALERAVKALPGHPELRHNLANILLKERQYCAAAEQYEMARALRHPPDDPSADPIVALQAFERASLQIETSRLCGAPKAVIGQIVAERRGLARRLLAAATSGAIDVAPELRSKLESAAADRPPTAGP